MSLKCTLFGHKYEPLSNKGRRIEYATTDDGGRLPIFIEEYEIIDSYTFICAECNQAFDLEEATKSGIFGFLKSFITGYQQRKAIIKNTENEYRMK